MGGGTRFFFKNKIPSVEILEMALMGEQQKECRECGWRGSAAELDETGDASTGKTHIFCPACGGVAIEDVKPGEKEKGAQASSDSE
jgi:predicted RNA-binding Zn-ribbon protein involved in translation (DUF1610 family)